LNLIFLFTIYSQNIDVLGYLPSYRFNEIDNIDLSLVTHVDIAFANPDNNGLLKPSGDDLIQIVKKIKDKGIIVYISLAGAGKICNNNIGRIGKGNLFLQISHRKHHLYRQNHKAIMSF